MGRVGVESEGEMSAMNCGCRVILPTPNEPCGGIDFCLLHSAAPDLLAACRIALDDGAVSEENARQVGFDRAWTALVHAIAKAEGRTQ